MFLKVVKVDPVGSRNPNKTIKGRQISVCLVVINYHR